MPVKHYNVLFLCTGNSARSIMAEALMNELGRAKGFRAFSAGSHAKGAVHPMALETLTAHHMAAEGLHSKSWDEFAAPDAPKMDFVLTVCDQAAGEVCPAWPGQPMSAHWGQPDPAAVQGDDATRSRAFLEAFVTLKRRIELMLALPLASLDQLSLQSQMDQIGTLPPMSTNVLILCTHNSARSVLSEGMLNHLARKLGKDVRAYSAGSAPSGRVNPYALSVLGQAGVDVSAIRSKSWDEFTGPGAPKMRIVITVCDNAAAETCPYWPGSPVQVHWGYPDPSNMPEDKKAQAFELTRQAIGYRMLQLLDLPIETLGNNDLQARLEALYRS